VIKQQADQEKARDQSMAAPEITDEIIANFNPARASSQTPGFIVGAHMLMEPSAEIDFPKTVAMARPK